MGYDAITLYDFNMLGTKNGEVAKLALQENAIIITLDSDFLHLKKNLLKKSRIIYIKIHPRDPKKIRELLKLNLNKHIKNLTNPCKIVISEQNTDPINF